MAVSVTPAIMKAKYNNSFLLRTTDRSKAGTIDDSVIQSAIDRAYVTLQTLCDLDITFWTEANLNIWWQELAYYWLFAGNEREKVAQDKLDQVKEEILAYKDIKNQSYTTIDTTYCEEDYLLDIDEIKEWE